MSNIYILEPPTTGKVVLETTVGDIDIELWSKEAPKACRNFVQLCLEHYYDGTIFHRVVKGFIVQGGDPTGTGMGGESIYGHPFKDEFHSRLRFVRRGLVAMANAGKDDNGSQFFFTLGPAPELQNKHTIFGKITGNTLYNMLKLEDSLVDQNDRPHYPHKIITAKVVMNPFPDIVPRVLLKESNETKDDKKSQVKATKNFSLLSFGEEAEEEEAETDAIAKEFRGKSKSSHDLANDPKLSSVPALDIPANEQIKSSSSEKNSQDGEASLERIRKKLKIDKGDGKEGPSEKIPEARKQDKSERAEDALEKNESQTKVEEIRKAIKKLKKELASDRKAKKSSEKVEETSNKEKMDVDDSDNSVLAEYRKETAKYKAQAQKLPKKGAAREDQTMAILAKFRSRLQNAKEKLSDAKVGSESEEEIPSDEEVQVDDKWLAHSLHCEEQGPVVARDVNLSMDDTFEIFDPRNPINKRRREASKEVLKHRR